MQVVQQQQPDFELDIVVGGEGSSRSIKIDLPPFTLVGATTRAGDISAPLRDRFGIINKLNYYTEDELKDIIKRTSKVLDMEITDEAATELWKNYQLYTEQFYDQLRLNHEMRAYDFKKNLEIKTHLCEAAEKLADLEDPISAFHQLQKLHQEYRETGPVAKEFRDEIWKRFKDASTIINKRHQDHFEAIKSKEEENLKKKTELCKKVEALDFESLNSLRQEHIIKIIIL